ncbi:MAG TPA: T9SS type A sorting domain-containing protein, partial [Ignavibacteriales bacterium]|nr:T9SS type A sorting domain-containing protein [Ignavibacteriales bacterium]
NDAVISGLNDWLYLGEAIRDTNLIGVGDKPLGPLTYSISQNYPNPFNPSTSIRYSIANAEQVDLKIYNILGQEALTLVNEFKNAGIYEVRFNAAGMNLASGVYIYRIRAGKFVQTKKLVLIK